MSSAQTHWGRAVLVEPSGSRGGAAVGPSVRLEGVAPSRCKGREWVLGRIWGAAGLRNRAEGSWAGAAGEGSGADGGEWFPVRGELVARQVAVRVPAPPPTAGT